MKPTLFELFGQSMPAYFAMVMVGFGLAIWLAARAAKRMDLDHDTMIDLGLFALIWGVIGARVLHVIADGYFWDYVHLCTDPSQVAWEITEARCAQVEGVWDTAAGVCRPAERDCFAWAAFWRGGLAYYGGLIAASAYGLHFLRKEGFPLGKGVDLVGMVMPLGLFFGRMGCFLGGCCFGAQVPDDHWAAVRFPAWSPASESQWKRGLLEHPHLPSLPVHPTQLYEAIGCLAIAAFLMLGLRPRKRFDGQLMLAFLGLYAVLRFGLEAIRADDRGGLLGLSTSQLIGVLILGLVGWLWVKLGRRDASPPAAA
ncbi:MAG TPA: prolipoprotein diacylglyceryl transferase [Polyangiaceae bacterium LLY-WYZ-15_(1-7)]|nr:prolipoprotein diacylglyceryl transferase [Myxococcales bacterium]MAT23773.1 prolipoprotein diacylglyceryl transferase [Sandaracinus sp.]HJK93630.1 prolipoprotein diacylglyceryl transferase [Polyangiaceae bacterium LLY-WYZ-15_(1-7)]MBJ71354.1 prolipoprotein diacylglyceryl transferase [Sandaracinus sp.]HJL06289.1 prolipoprotein diacylglyceryl transferase [Polyangiaceae bacterium LLY-WYZ-15_(1-7)]